jgi:hypothetical protein
MDAGGGMDAAAPDSGGRDARPGRDVGPPRDVDCTGVGTPVIERARIRRSLGVDVYDVELEWSLPGATADDEVIAAVAPRVDGEFVEVMAPVLASVGSGTAEVDKLLPDLFIRLLAIRAGVCAGEPSPPVRLAKPDYADPGAWGIGWIRVVSHTHTIADLKEDRGAPVHANRINWFNGCYDVAGDDAACHDLLLSSFAESGVTWLMDAAADVGIDSVIITDHDNVGIWFTDTFRRHNRASATAPSVVHGLEWTSALGHLTVVGNFLPEIPRDADVYDPATGRMIHTSVPLPPDRCDDTDENHDVNDPAFDGPDAPCARADHRGHGDDPPSMAEARTAIEALRARGALVFANHPTNDSFIEPPMMWRLGNLDLLDGVEANTPDPTATNRNAPEYWRDQGLRAGRRWIGIAGTDCHVNGPPYAGDTGCNEFHGITNLTHMDAPYMWMQPLGSTSEVAPNAPRLVVAALREGRVTVVQDVDPAVVADLGIDVNGDGQLDYWSGSTVPACEQPGRDDFTIEVRVRPVQTHNYNVNIWRNTEEVRIADRTEIRSGMTWTGSIDFSRSRDIPAGNDLGFAMAWVREDLTARPDVDAGFSNPIFFEAADPSATPCDTRDSAGD